MFAQLHKYCGSYFYNRLFVRNAHPGRHRANTMQAIVELVDAMYTVAIVMCSLSASCVTNVCLAHTAVNNSRIYKTIYPRNSSSQSASDTFYPSIWLCFWDESMNRTHSSFRILISRVTSETHMICPACSARLYRLVLLRNLARLW